jgi:DNA helicase-2/ATP-dependent DNA helicase PcrA
MERLYLIRAKARTMYGRYDNTIESRFLREIDREYLDGADKIGSDTTAYFHGAMGAEDGFASAEVFRPFDRIRQIREEVAGGRGGAGGRIGGGGSGGGSGSGGSGGSSGSGTAPLYKAGEKVSHRKFGEGTVLEADGKVVTVMFGSVGKKRLAADIAPLEKL